MSWQALKYSVEVCRGIKAQDRAVLSAISYHSKKEEPHLAFISQKRLAEWCEISRSTAKASLKRLQAAGELEMVQVGGIGAGNEHLATNWRLLGVERWINGLPKADPSGDKSRPRWGQVPAPEWGRNLIPIEDKDKRQTGDKNAADASPLPRFNNEEGNEQPCSQPILNEAGDEASKVAGAAQPLPTGVAAQSATGAAKAAIEARVRELAALHPADDEAWFAALRAAPEFSDIEVDFVARKFLQRKGTIERRSFVWWLFREDRTRHRPMAAAPVETALERNLRVMREEWRRKVSAELAGTDAQHDGRRAAVGGGA